MASGGPVPCHSFTGRASIPEKKVSELTEEEVNHLRNLIEGEGAIEGDLRKEVSLNIKRLMEMGSYRGLAPPSWVAGSWAAHAYQCAHP